MFCLILIFINFIHFTKSDAAESSGCKIILQITMYISAPMRATCTNYLILLNFVVLEIW